MVHVQVLKGKEVVAERTVENGNNYNFKLPTGSYVVRAGSFTTGPVSVTEDETTTLPDKVTACATPTG